MKKYSNRKKAITKIKQMHKNALFVSSTGLLSRELYQVSDSSKNFYMMGSMGSALGFAIGVALNKDKEIVVLVGDGEILMSLGTMVLLNRLRKDSLLQGNIELYIFDNNRYESTGGQPTCSDAVDFEVLTDCTVIKVGESEKPPRVPLKHKYIFERFSKECRS